MNRVVVAGLVTAGMVLVGCAGDGTVAAAACDGEVSVETATMVAHEGSEADAIRAAIDGFNSGPGADLGLTVDLTVIPEGLYTESLAAAAASDDLPDIIDHDGPNMANLAWAGSLSPLDECIPDDLRSNVLPSLIEQGP